MKKVIPYILIATFFEVVPPLQAQNPSVLGQDPPEKPDELLAQKFDVPVVRRAVSFPEESFPAFYTQDVATLHERAPQRKVSTVVDLGLLQEPSSFAKSLKGVEKKRVEVAAHGLSSGLALISAVYRANAVPAAEADCHALGLSLENRILIDRSRLLQMVEEEMTASPGCACEIVKSAIKAAGGDSDAVAAIVETSILANPESMRLISQCAIASAPGSLSQIQALLAKLDPNSGESGKLANSAKSAKAVNGQVASEVASEVVPVDLPNVLDTPPSTPPSVPPVVNVPDVTPDI